MMMLTIKYKITINSKLSVVVVKSRIKMSAEIKKLQKFETKNAKERNTTVKDRDEKYFFFCSRTKRKKQGKYVTVDCRPTTYYWTFKYYYNSIDLEEDNRIWRMQMRRENIYILIN